MAQFHIGTSGYQYNHWRGILYPKDVPVSRWFDIYTQHFDTVEINNSFYRLPSPQVFRAWRDRAPPGFIHAVKFSRFGSHMKKLKEPENTVGRFMDAASELGPTLGPVLVHLPPRWKVNVQRLDAFLQVASEARVGSRRLNWAVEVRDPSWLIEPVYQTLRRYRAALCIHDWIHHHPAVLTTGWTYLRFHGSPLGTAVNGNYPDSALKEAAAQIRAWLRRGITVYTYFNNDQHGHAIHNAKRLRELVEPASIQRSAPAPGREAEPGRREPARARARRPARTTPSPTRSRRR